MSCRRRRFESDRGGVNLGEMRSSRPQARGRGRVLLTDFYIRTLASEICLSIYVENSPRHRPRPRRSLLKKDGCFQVLLTTAPLRRHAASRGAAKQSEEDCADGAHVRRSAREADTSDVCVSRGSKWRGAQHRNLELNESTRFLRDTGDIFHGLDSGSLIRKSAPELCALFVKP